MVVGTVDKRLHAWTPVTVRTPALLSKPLVGDNSLAPVDSLRTRLWNAVHRLWLYMWICP